MIFRPHATITYRSAVIAFSSRRPRGRPLSWGPRMASSSATSALPRLPIFEAVARHDPAATAVVHARSGRCFSYGGLLGDVRRARDRMREAAGEADLRGHRIAFMFENSYDYVVIFLAILAARCIAVPLAPAFPAPELQYILDQSEASLFLSSAKFAVKAQEVLAKGLKTPPKHLTTEKHRRNQSVPEPVVLEDDDSAAAGLMLYTSGTADRPKSVLLSQAVLTAQSRSLIEAWQYSPSDHLLHVLPLHHIHGTVNALFTPLIAGSSIEFLFPFNADEVWKRLAAPFLGGTASTSPSNSSTHTRPPKVTFFTAVPTVYSRLLASHKSLPSEVQEASCRAIAPGDLRLNISGSAALPTPVKSAWQRLSRGNVLLERFGMTEVGMALSCGLDLADRVDASVGWPLPSVQVRLVDVDSGQVIAAGQERDADGRERTGEIQLRGPTVFSEYWRNPEATAKEFVDDLDDQGPWFKTGDVAIRRTVSTAGHGAQPWARGPLYFIRGRRSVDIIKTGGEKVSALEVERELLSLPEVAEAAVVAVPSGNWGQKVGVVVVLNKEVVQSWTPLEMRRALRGQLPNYKIPQVMKTVESIPRNAMGKINKKRLVETVFAEDISGDELGATSSPSTPSS